MHIKNIYKSFCPMCTLKPTIILHSLARGNMFQQSQARPLLSPCYPRR